RHPRRPSAVQRSGSSSRKRRLPVRYRAARTAPRGAPPASRRRRLEPRVFALQTPAGLGRRARCDDRAAMISIVIPVRNGGADLRSCLEATEKQQIDEELEVVVVDSQSTDGSAQLAAEWGARVQTIPVAEF